MGLRYKTSLLIGLGLGIAFQSVKAQDGNWYHQNKTSQYPTRINTNFVYDNIIKDKQGRTVVVAVIDSGVDIEHEDLDDVIWVNKDEIPDNGIDDDKNGYIDDVHGWNFIGGKDGSQVGPDTYEATRIYAKLRKRFADVDPATLSKADLEQYNLYNRLAKNIENQKETAEKKYAQFEQIAEMYDDVAAYLEEVTTDGVIDDALIEKLSQDMTDPRASVASQVIGQYVEQKGEFPTVKEMHENLKADIQPALDYYGNKYKYAYNPEFDPRTIVGDDYHDVNQRDYGNNLVEGPDAMHGTHVAGIIAAERNNGIGMNGIANNAQIMVLRAVPDGDERDKDVANAIRYAVDNGADIINMSFGKGQSPQKHWVDDAIRYAEKNDVLLIHAAGNSHLDIDDSDNNYVNVDKPNENFPNDRYIKPKGFLFFKKKKAKNYITVGAVSPRNDETMVASFSNYGLTNVDLFAPGQEIYSTVPDDKYTELQGTSMAAPVVSGVAAMIRSYFPTLTATQVKEVLIDSVMPIKKTVIKPGTEEKAPFAILSVSGGVVDMKAAFAKASLTKGKKKVNKDM